MFVLIIGINKYKDKDCHDLHDAVSDARAIESYLMDSLGVDKSRIRMLLDEEASRQGIIDALVALRDNDDIEHGEAILIYYSGHDGETSALDGWTIESTEKQIPSIIPQDFNDGKGVHRITNQTFVWLIDDIVRKRGDNIVCPRELNFACIPNDLLP